MTPYKNMTKTERRELRAFLECQFRKIGYLIGIRTDGAWIATPLGRAKTLSSRTSAPPRSSLRTTKEQE